MKTTTPFQEVDGPLFQVRAERWTNRAQQTRARGKTNRKRKRTAEERAKRETEDSREGRGNWKQKKRKREGGQSTQTDAHTQLTRHFFADPPPRGPPPPAPALPPHLRASTSPPASITKAQKHVANARRKTKRTLRDASKGRKSGTRTDTHRDRPD